VINMAGAVRQGDSISGTTTGEHHGHYRTVYIYEDKEVEFENEAGEKETKTETVVVGSYEEPIHKDPSELTGTISSGSGDVIINGSGAVRVGDLTSENDACGSGSGSITVGSGSVIINGRAAARNGDSIQPHNGTAKISSGSANVVINEL